MKLSIIVPVYNMEADNKLRFCMESLINQTITDYEIITIDDKSTDHSLSILREYEQKYPEKEQKKTFRKKPTTMTKRATSTTTRSQPV